MNLFKKKSTAEKNKDFANTGCENLDYLLAGGLPAGIVTQIYGRPGSGKTNICMAAAIEAAKNGQNVIYIDTENNFNKFRFEQIAGEKAAEIAKRIYLHSPKNLAEQKEAIGRLDKILDKNFSLVVVDSFVALYRLELSGGNRESVIPFTRELGKQMAILSDIARRHKAAVAITNQVYDSFTETDALKEEIPVGGSSLDYWSKIILRIEKQGKDRLVTLQKHAFREDEESIKIKITKGGLQ